MYLWVEGLSLDTLCPIGTHPVFLDLEMLQSQAQDLIDGMGMFDHMHENCTWIISDLTWAGERYPSHFKTRNINVMIPYSS
jgi:hypothetical protein